MKSSLLLNTDPFFTVKSSVRKISQGCPEMLVGFSHSVSHVMSAEDVEIYFNVYIGSSQQSDYRF